MATEKELEAYGCKVFTLGGTGLKISVKNREVAILHLTTSGMAVGSANLDAANARRLSEELAKAADKLEKKLESKQ